ncbi:MAG: hypothetical protein ABJQ29_10895 [Luteolibacter sp.]
MNITKTLSLSVAACAVASGLSNAQTATSFDFTSTSFANYRQVSPGGVEVTNFEGGAFALSVRDGNAVYVGGACGNGAPLYYPPSPGCSLGATGLVTAGDLNGDGVQDPGTYFSISSISAAAILQPFDGTKALLVSAPPSLLPRPLSGFVDTSASIFYNLQTAFIQKYDITLLNLNRGYTAAERTRFDNEVVPGTYNFNFARLINPFFNGVYPPVVLQLNLFPALDGFRKVNNVKQGFRFKNVTFQDGFAILDPLELNTLEWEGNTVSYIAPAADSLYISIKPLTDPEDPYSDPIQYDGLGQFLDAPDNTIVNPTFPIFPNFVGPTTTRIFLPNPLVQSYIIPPNFLGVGQTGVIDIEFVLNRPTSTVISDRSTRRFRLPVRLVNRFRTAIASKLPVTATTLQQSADYDFDGDGFSNFSEWAFGSDPANAASTPNSAKLQTVAPSTSAYTRDGQTTTQNGLKFEITKLQNPDPALTYDVEFSTDMKTWTTVSKTDPKFVRTETADKLTVTTVGLPSGGGFFRSKVQEKK